MIFFRKIAFFLVLANLFRVFFQNVHFENGPVLSKTPEELLFFTIFCILSDRFFFVVKNSLGEP